MALSDDTSKLSQMKSTSSLRSAKLISMSQKSLDYTDDELVESIHERVSNHGNHAMVITTVSDMCI